MEKVYQALLSESEKDITLKALKMFMDNIPNVHHQGHLHLKAFEAFNEVEIGTEIDINNKMESK